MSYKTSLIKTAIKWTPKKLVSWVVNTQLKGIAELSTYNFDIDARKAYGQVQLAGEPEPIEVWAEDFEITNDGENYHFVLGRAQSNKLWLDNAMARIVGKAWKIPVPAQYRSQFQIVADLFKAVESPLVEESESIEAEADKTEA